jgi:predicted nucleotidyltransferase
VDLVVTFDDSWTQHYADTYFGLLAGLEDLFARKVDLLTDRSIENPYLRQAIEADRRPLFAAP